MCVCVVPCTQRVEQNNLCIYIVYIYMCVYKGKGMYPQIIFRKIGFYTAPWQRGSWLRSGTPRPHLQSPSCRWRNGRGFDGFWP